MTAFVRGLVAKCCHGLPASLITLGSLPLCRANTNVLAKQYHIEMFIKEWFFIMNSEWCFSIFASTFISRKTYVYITKDAYRDLTNNLLQLVEC